MKGWHTHIGQAVVLPIDNIDTDQIIPARFMSQPRSSGYGHLLFHDLRQDSHGQSDTSFILNRFPDASILIAGKNFGNGSSREAAVYALLDAGIQAIVATSFADIFLANAINNGLLPACASEDSVKLIGNLFGHQSNEARISLKTRTISIGGNPKYISLPFTIEDSLCTKLIKGLDDIAMTMNCTEVIDEFRQKRSEDCPWAFPPRQQTTNQ